MRQLLFSLLLFSVTANAVAQLKTISGASVANIAVNIKERSAVIEVLNKSSQDITGFVLAVDAIYSGGRKDPSEFTEDYGAFYSKGGMALHPGETKQVLQLFLTPTKEAFLNVEATIITVAYLDQTAETTSDDALSRLIAMRRDTMLAYRQSADAISQVLSDPTNQHPTGPALQRIREEMDQANALQWNEGPHADRAYLNDVAKELANAPSLAIQQKVTEREILQRMLADKEQKANLYARYSTLKKLHEPNIAIVH